MVSDSSPWTWGRGGLCASFDNRIRQKGHCPRTLAASTSCFYESWGMCGALSHLWEVWPPAGGTLWGGSEATWVGGCDRAQPSSHPPRVRMCGNLPDPPDKTSHQTPPGNPSQEQGGGELFFHFKNILFIVWDYIFIFAVLIQSLRHKDFQEPLRNGQF